MYDLLITGYLFVLCRLDYLFAAAAAYFCGCCNGALLTSRLFFHDDVRTHGSGNAGLTNFYRTYGAKYAALVIACDMLKAAAAVGLAAWLGARFDPRIMPDLPLTAAQHAEFVLHFKYWAGLFCVVGHMFPCTAKFKGGKGILCSATLTLLLDWRIALVCWSLFALLWLTTRYVSLGSISAAAAFPILTWLVFGDVLAAALSVCIAALVVWAHRENIRRLRNGTENKFHFHVNAPKTEEEKMNLVVLGSGGWGTAIAMLLQKNGNAVTLWSHDAKKAVEMSRSRNNPLLQNVSIPTEISITNDLNCLKAAELAVFAPPSFALRAVAKQAAPYLPAGAVLLSVTKGIERGTHLRMSQVIAQETGGEHPLAVLSGPSHAEEVARGIPTGVVAASADERTAQLVQTLFTNDDFRVYTHDDMVGVELAGALKNVAALCCGVSDGCGLGDNTKALLITRAMAETSRLAERLGGRKETLAGLAGMGDLIVTCTSRHSRNRRAGIAIGEGRAPQEVIADMGGVVEGYYAAVSAKELADALGVEMPICSAVYDVLYHGAAVEDMIRRLMRRAPKRETDSKWV